MSKPNNNVIIELVNVSLVYKPNLKKNSKTNITDEVVVVKALDDVSLKIKKGELVGIVGPSGSGKSTLMHVIGLLDKPTSGHVLVNGQSVGHLSETQTAYVRNKTIGFVFQQFNLLPRTSAVDNVKLPLTYSRTFTGSPTQRAIELLRQVGLGERLKNTPAQLSGGQQQRVAIARAISNEPDILLADEPTGNLDSASGKTILEVIKKLHSQGRTIIIVTHDPNMSKFFERTITMKDGKVISDKKR